ncbi:hypothetical protein TNCV_3302681 [Trichonephila clavipes]|nr:hypothetical protein TNCV_3302681 [Trichonephila clavipes]
MKEIILDVRFPKQKNRRVIFQCGDRARLTAEHVVLLTATLPLRFGQKNCMTNIRVIWPLGVVRSLPPLFLFHQPHERTCDYRRLFRVPLCRKGTIRLQTSLPSPGIEPRPYGTAVSVANHYIGWATTNWYSQEDLFCGLIVI